MPKESPFFKFDSQGWLSGSIQFTTLECKGLFIDLCALYWDTQKPIKIDAKLKVRCRCDEGTLSDLIGTLSDLEIITVSNSEITIPFIDTLMQERDEWLKKCGEGGRKSSKSKGTYKVPPSNKKEERREKNEECRKKNVDTAQPKEAFAEFVHLSQDEYQKAIDKYGDEDRVSKAIDKLNNYKASSGKKYKSDYHVIVGWVYDDAEKARAAKSNDDDYDYISGMLPGALVPEPPEPENPLSREEAGRIIHEAMMRAEEQKKKEG